MKGTDSNHGQSHYITFITEKHQLLPANHFGSRLGRTMADTVPQKTGQVF